ncbi:hypothetical protein Tco_1039131 [Tanacetum coccineum]
MFSTSLPQLLPSLRIHRILRKKGKKRSRPPAPELSPNRKPSYVFPAPPPGYRPPPPPLRYRPPPPLRRPCVIPFFCSPPPPPPPPPPPERDPISPFLFILVMEGLHVALMEETKSGLILGFFYLASGLKINIHKSNVYGVGVPDNEKILLDRFDARMSKWKVNLFSIGGRLTLFKSVLGSLGIYYLSIFRASKSVLNLLNSNPKALWVKVVKALHGHEGGFGLNDNTSNGIWSKIVGSSNYLHSNDILPSDSIRLFCLELNKDCLISERFINNHWTWNWSRPILGTRNLAYLNDLINEINPIELSIDLDACIWTIADDGVFLLALLGITLTGIFCPLWIIRLSGTKVFHISTGKIGWVHGMRPKRSLVVYPLSLPPLSGGFGGNNHADMSSLSNILHTSVMIHSNIIVRRDGTVQSFCGLKLSDLGIPITSKHTCILYIPGRPEKNRWVPLADTWRRLSNDSLPRGGDSDAYEVLDSS